MILHLSPWGRRKPNTHTVPVLKEWQHVKSPLCSAEAVVPRAELGLWLLQGSHRPHPEEPAWLQGSQVGILHSPHNLLLSSSQDQLIFLPNCAFHGAFQVCRHSQPLHQGFNYMPEEEAPSSDSSSRCEEAASSANLCNCVREMG